MQRYAIIACLGCFLLDLTISFDCDELKECPNKLCCSKYHYCGTDEPWCGEGCLSGNCFKKTVTTTKSLIITTVTTLTTLKSTNTTKPTVASLSSTSTLLSTLSTFKCNYEICLTSECCSKYGYCGIGDAWCGEGCQGGNCNSKVATTTTLNEVTTQFNGPSTSKDSKPSGSCLITNDEFVDAILATGPILTKFGYNAPPPPSDEQYRNLCAGAPTKGNINSKQQLAMFLAQIAWESIGLKEKRELICIQSGCIGTYGYGAPGKGYYGRGYMQLSWPSNYAAASQALFGDDRLYQNPDLVASNDAYAWDTAYWFWRTNVATRYGTQSKHFGDSTMAINGGLECNGPYRDRARGRYDIYVSMFKIFNINESPIERGCYN